MKIEKTERIRMAYGVIRDETEALINDKELLEAQYAEMYEKYHKLVQSVVVAYYHCTENTSKRDHYLEKMYRLVNKQVGEE
jgi:hypothetical protein